MNEPIDAIYENGVLRPLEPLSLPENARVRVTVSGLSDEELYRLAEEDLRSNREAVERALAQTGGITTEELLRRAAEATDGA